MIWSGKTIVFDLDGTLVDTAPDLHAALTHAYSTIGLEAIDLHTVRSTIGHGARAMILKSAEIKQIVLEQDRIDQLHRAFLDYYTANMTVHSVLFPGMKDSLSACLDNRAILSVCTNKTQLLAEQVLEELGIRDMFSSVVGADRASEKKPSPLHLQETISLAGGTAQNAVMIGDSSSDGLSAAAAGIPFILMTYGYPDEQVGILKPEFVLDNAGKLPEAIHTLFS